jgi:hypothetical protein
MDAMSWQQREQRFQKKFDAGRQFIHSLFTCLELPQEIDQRAMFVFASNKVHQTVGGGRIVQVREPLQEIFAELESKSLFRNTIPEHLEILTEGSAMNREETPAVVHATCLLPNNFR